MRCHWPTPHPAPACLAEPGIPVVAACTGGDYVPELLSDYDAGVERMPGCQTSLPYERIAALEDTLVDADPDVLGE